jgi:hypothetical protein
LDGFTGSVTRTDTGKRNVPELIGNMQDIGYYLQIQETVYVEAISVCPFSCSSVQDPVSAPILLERFS